MKIITRKLHELIPYARNARKITPKAIEKIALSLKEYGWQQPIVVDKQDVIIVGHVRRLAAISLGWVEGPVHIADKLTPAQVRAYRIMDNRSNNEVEFDYDLLKLELGEIQGLGLDLAVTGFDARESHKLLAAGAQEGEDDVPAVQEAIVTRPGDLWVLGNHRLLCGDATKGEDVARVMAGERAALCLTDPPYGVGVKYESFIDTPENVKTLIPALMRLISDCCCGLFTPGIPSLPLYPPPTWMLAWVHPAPSGGCPWGFADLNPILAYGADPYLKAGLGRRPGCLVLGADRKGEDGHPTPKPVAVWRWLMLRGSVNAADIVLDPFVGSGTTMIAAETENRRCFGLEIEPRYCDVIIRRWEKFTAKQAALGDGPYAGLTFASTREGRLREAGDAIMEEALNAVR